jgi:hypothetical protein
MKIGLWHAVAVPALAFATYHVGAFVYVLYIMMSEAQKPNNYGGTVTISDEIRGMFPLHFELLQSFTRMPIPNYSARKYYAEQKEFFAAAAREFELHPYWADTELSEQPELRNQLHERVKSMLRQLRSDKRRDDYRVEKDRCAMYEFLSANSIPFPPLLGEWHDREKLLADLRSGAAIAEAKDWPIFLKACHLTQHSSSGTKSIVSKKAFETSLDGIVGFVDSKWQRGHTRARHAPQAG